MTSSPLDAFHRKWRTAGGAERANAQPFLCDLCELLGVPGPDPAKAISQILHPRPPRPNRAALPPCLPASPCARTTIRNA